MMNDIKKNELNDLETANVAGGTWDYDNNPDNVIRSQENLNLFMSFSDEERAQVYALPDANSRREKMYELGNRKETPGQVHAHGGGVSGSW